MIPRTSLAPDPRPVAAGVRDLDRTLDAMFSDVGAQDELPAMVVELDRIGRRVDALKLRLVAAAERSTVARDQGFTGTDAWLARQTRTTPSAAAAEVRLAKGLDGGCATTRDALSHGDLSTAHAAVVVDALGKLPATVGPAQREQVEADLVRKAERFDPGQLRRIARRALEVVEPDPAVVDAHENSLVHAEEQAARPRVRLTWHENDDGTVSGHFTTTSLAFAMLRKVIDAMTAPRRMRVERGAGVDWSARRGTAFTEVLEHLPTDHLSLKTAATVVVHIRHEVLTEQLAAVGIADTGDRIFAGEARRLACTAGIIPTVLGGPSLPLDLGRQERLFTEAQRVALGKVHETCAADGCTRPYAWCELHHRDPWARGGRTDLRDAVPLCAEHHRGIHDPDRRVRTSVVRT